MRTSLSLHMGSRGKNTTRAGGRPQKRTEGDTVIEPRRISQSTFCNEVCPRVILDCQAMVGSRVSICFFAFVCVRFFILTLVCEGMPLLLLFLLTHIPLQNLSVCSWCFFFIDLLRSKAKATNKSVQSPIPYVRT